MMEAVWDFLWAALPWIAMGLLLAAYFAGCADRKQGDASSDYAAEGMDYGMCLGLCLFTALGKNIGLGLSAGMLIGLLVGSRVRKKGHSDDEADARHAKENLAPERKE